MRRPATHWPMMTKSGHFGFTLIELLIVVGIIAILASIAVINFLEAQTRARISRVKSDLRTIASAVEIYGIDNRRHPIPLNYLNDPNGWYDALRFMHELTTPVAYLTSVSLPDPFSLAHTPPTYWYYNYSGAYIQVNPGLAKYKFNGFCVVSNGPDQKGDGVAVVPMFIGTEKEGKNWEKLYDPSNGAVSRGDIARWIGKRSIGF